MRRDWYLWRLHIIRRHYNDPQYGTLLWGSEYGWAYDIWFHRTLWTFRWHRDR